MHPSDAAHKTLEITVWDFDRGPSNDFIGGLTLGADAKAERRELWLAVFRPPYRRIEAWFQLSSRTQNENQSSTPEFRFVVLRIVQRPVLVLSYSTV
ncbi:hypothetical protein X801_03911 [Opisthorchis viverrini]|uniref:C2 domain-containing protein n=1 Tax=Opisthorchis viverrini TaxID=6198 RepID=A0A1S8X0H7_OPIVI|nr:hypothetical protein X801_03911 [Opisthorchis viverrini]